MSETKTYAERYLYLAAEALDEVAARAALMVPAADENVTWSPAAVAEVVTQSGCYPYFLQQLGQDAWTAAAGPTIKHQDALLGIATGRAHLDNGFFRVRWDRATLAVGSHVQLLRFPRSCFVADPMVRYLLPARHGLLGAGGRDRQPFANLSGSQHFSVPAR